MRRWERVSVNPNSGKESSAAAKPPHDEREPAGSLLLRNRWPGPILFGEAAEGGVEAGVESLLQRLGRQPRRLLAVVREVHEPGDQRTWVRTAQRLFSVQVVEEIPDRL